MVLSLEGSQCQTTNVTKIPCDSHLTLIKMATIKKPGNRTVGKVVEKLEPLCTVGGDVKWCSHYEKQRVVPQKIKNRIPHDPEIVLLNIYLKELKAKSCRNICILIFIVALHSSKKVGVHWWMNG